MSRIKGLLGLGLVATAALPLSAVYAAEDGTLEEIVVTAQKRVESVQEVPVAVTVSTTRKG